VRAPLGRSLGVPVSGALAFEFRERAGTAGWCAQAGEVVAESFALVATVVRNARAADTSRLFRGGVPLEREIPEARPTGGAAPTHGSSAPV